MYYFLEILCTISSVNSLTWNINAHLDLGPKPLKLDSMPVRYIRLQQSEAAGDDRSGDVHLSSGGTSTDDVTAESDESVIRSTKKIYAPLLLTKRKTKYEQGTTKKYTFQIERNKVSRKETQLNFDAELEKDPIKLMKIFSNTLSEYVKSMQNRMAHFRSNNTIAQLDQHLNNEAQNTLNWLNNFEIRINKSFYANNSADLLKSAVRDNINKFKNETKISDKDFDYIWQRSVKVKDDETINSFTKDILNHTLRLFDDIENKIPEYEWRKRVRRISRIYESKYEDFLKDIKQHTIKTKYGTQKVILNSIDESNRIVNRLFNYFLHKMEQDNILRNSGTPDLLFQEIAKSASWGFEQACNKLSICRSNNGFIQFVADFMTNILIAENEKFKQAFDSLTEAGKNAKLRDKEIEKLLHKKILRIEEYNPKVQRAGFEIFRNMLLKRNQPISTVTGQDPPEKFLKATLAFFEIANTLDEKIPANSDNIRKWNDLKHKSLKWANNENFDIQEIMEQFVEHAIDSINNLDNDSYRTVMSNCKVLLTL